MFQRTICCLRSFTLIKVQPFKTLSTMQTAEPLPQDRMFAWQIHSYGGIQELQLSKARIPQITKPNDVLVRVEAASVNPIDVAMSEAYGATAINIARRMSDPCVNSGESFELPLVLGRDFAGEVVSKGCGVKSLEYGDKIWGLAAIHRQGCHAQYVLVDETLVRRRPPHLTHIEAASIPYAAFTAWNSLWIVGGICQKIGSATKYKNKVLILGGTGGVGTSAVQLLHAWNMPVIATCRTDAMFMVKELGADVVIDYTAEDADTRIIEEGPYDVILDCANQGLDAVRTKNIPHTTYISLNSPLLKNMDQYGAIRGVIKNVQDLLMCSLFNNSDKRVRWSFIIPNSACFNAIQTLVVNKQLKPVIQQVFEFKDLRKAYEKLAAGHARGKIVVDFKESDAESQILK